MKMLRGLGNHNRLAISCILGIVILSLATTAGAQSAGTGSIVGRVTDEKGAVVPSAKVTVRNEGTNITRELQTDALGDYRAVLLQPGSYEVTIQAQGFATLKRTGVRVEVGSTITADAELKVAGVSEVVTVTGQGTLLEPEKTESSQTVSQILVQNLPINGRRWEDFVLLTPGVTTDGGFGLVSYRGISSLYNNNTVDGADNNQAFFSESRGRTRIAYAYSLQTIQEFQVTNSNYSAEFGRSAGGIVNAVTKSGTNDWHGSAFYYLRQFHANALDPFLKFQALSKGQTTFTKPELIRHQFGGDVGLPIIRDKLFFYGAYDGQRRSFPVGVVTDGNYFSVAATQGNCLLAGAAAAQCTAAINFLQSITGSFPRKGNQDIYFGKLDYQANANNRIGANLNWHDWRGPNAFLTFPTTSSAVSNNGFDRVKSRFVVVDWSSTLRSNLVNDFRFQYGKDFEAGDPNSGGPAVSLTGGPTYGENQSLPRLFFPDERRWQATESVSILRGRHNLKAGFDFNAIHEKLANLFQGNGNYSYAGATTTIAFQNWIRDVFRLNTVTMIGMHYSFSFTQAADPITGIGADDFWDYDYAGYFQDSWKLRSNLTLNYGLRYDVQTVPQPSNPNTRSPLLTLFTSTINIDKHNFGPRLALAWQVTPKTVARLGYGLYYGKTSNSTFYAQRVENGIFQLSFSCSATDACGPTFPNLIVTPPGPPPAAPFAGAVTPQVINTNPPLGNQLSHGLASDFVNPRVHMGELVIERELPWNISISGSYLFSRGLHLPIFVDTNLAPTTMTRTYDVTDSSGLVTQSTVTVPLYTSRIDTNAGIILTGFSVVNSWYHGFVLTARKRYSQGLELLANLTVSKAIDDGEIIGTNGTFAQGNTPLDPKNLKLENALSDLDQRRRFVMSAFYTPPFSRISNTLVRKMFDGFGFAGVLTLADGRPVTGFISGSPPVCATSAGGTGDGGVTCGELDRFGSPTGGRNPAVGRNTFLGHGLEVFDFRVQRDIKFKERYSLRVLVEAFNLFNHTNVTDVTTTAFGFSRSGAGSCTGHTNDCLIARTNFLADFATSNRLYGARQMQLSLRFGW